jgi:DNA-binding winged helix-turn-helix (wHTH) protein
VAPTTAAIASVFRFGAFELDAKNGALRRDGAPVKLPPQPFKVLVLLATRPGELVTREEIQQQVWGGETFVDFELGLNYCLNQIRAALGDHSQSPYYIETVHKRGYRFIAPVETVAPVSSPATPVGASPAPASHGHPKGAPRPEIESIAVLPLENLSRDPEQEYFVDGMTEELITVLGKD